MAEIHAVNAQNAVQNAGRTREETLELLKSQGAAAAAGVRALDEAALDRSGPIGLLDGKVLTVEQLIQVALIGHPSGHLASIQSALASGSAE
jgi:hypothetical protein